MLGQTDPEPPPDARRLSEFFAGPKNSHGALMEPAAWDPALQFTYRRAASDDDSRPFAILGARLIRAPRGAGRPMFERRRLSDDGTRRHKSKITLGVLAVVTGIAGLALFREPQGLFEGVFLLSVIAGCALWSLRSSTWFVADSVDLVGTQLIVKRGQRIATIDFVDVVDVARGEWSTGRTVVLSLRSPLDGFGNSVTYRAAGADESTSRELNAAVADLRAKVGLPPVLQPENELTPEGRLRLSRKRRLAMLVVVLCLPILVSSIFELSLFSPYDRQLTAIAMAALFVVVYFVFSQSDRDAMADARKRTRR